MKKTLLFVTAIITYHQSLVAASALTRLCQHTRLACTRALSSKGAQPASSGLTKPTQKNPKPLEYQVTLDRQFKTYRLDNSFGGFCPRALPPYIDMGWIIAKEFKGPLPPKGSALAKKIDPQENLSNLFADSCGKGKLTERLRKSAIKQDPCQNACTQPKFCKSRKKCLAKRVIRPPLFPKRSITTFSKKESHLINNAFKSFIQETKGDLTAQRFEMKHIKTLQNSLMEDLDDESEKSAGLFEEFSRRGQDDNPNVFNKVLTWYSEKYLFHNPEQSRIKSAVIRARAYEFYDKEEKTRQRDSETADDIWLELKAVLAKTKSGTLTVKPRILVSQKLLEQYVATNQAHKDKKSELDPVVTKEISKSIRQLLKDAKEKSENKQDDGTLKADFAPIELFLRQLNYRNNQTFKPQRLHMVTRHSTIRIYNIKQYEFYYNKDKTKEKRKQKRRRTKQKKSG